MNVCIPRSLLAMPVEQLTPNQRLLVSNKNYFSQKVLTGQFKLDGDQVTRIGDIPPRPLFLALVDLLNQRRSRVKAEVAPTYADLQIASLSSRLPRDAKLLDPGMGRVDKLVFTVSGQVAVVQPSWTGVTVTVTGQAADSIRKSISDEMYHALVEQVLVD